MKNGILAIASGFAAVSLATAAAAVTYTSDGTLSDFTAGVTNYATLSNFSSGDTSSPYTPTAASIASGLRVYAGGTVTGLTGSDWILATFSAPVSGIRVFPNMDHLGAGYDGYQYSIEGSNDGVSWTPLFDALSVTGSGEPFTLGTFTGTAPFSVNNVVTPGAGPGGTVGYIADFTFGSAYRYYAFGASTEAGIAGNIDQELSGVASVPEPMTWVLMLIGIGGVGASLRRSIKLASAAA